MTVMATFNNEKLEQVGCKYLKSSNYWWCRMHRGNLCNIWKWFGNL